MKLYGTLTSPYVRKVRITAQEIGRDLEFVAAHPHDANAGVEARNPLRKIPVLELDSGKIIYDSPVICEYLDQFERAPTLVPSSGQARYDVLQDQALGDGILDAALNVVLETRRPNSERSAWWIERWETNILR